MESELDEALFRCRILQQEIDNGGRRLEAIEEDLARVRNEKVQLMTSATSASREVEDLRASISIVSSEKDSMKATIETLRKEVERLQSELHVRNRQLADRPSFALQNLQSENTTSTAASSNGDSESRRVEHELIATRDALSQSESLCSQLQVSNLVC